MARESSAVLNALEADPFKIYCYKIVPCAKKFGHDWSECPFAHEGEKATRRCPALYLYSSIVCPDVRQSKPCPRGDVCPYSHSIFEYWMHPARFRAQMCSFGAECNRRICFFAHAQDQLRVPSEPIIADALASRAPYLQGRVCPKTRYALYPDQVPAAGPIAGVMQQQLLQQDLGGGQGMGPMMLVPAGASGVGGMAMGAAGAQMGGLQQQQQWAQGGGMMYVPAAQPGGGAGLGYYMAPAPVSGSGLGHGGGMPGQQFSGAMVLPPGGLQMAAGPGGQGFSGSQPVQLVAAMGPDGNIAQYPMAAQGMPGGGVASAPLMYAPAGPGSFPLPMQQGWGLQQFSVQHGQQHGQQQQQQMPQRDGQQGVPLMQVPKPVEGLGHQPGSQEGFLLAQQAFPPRQSRPLDAGGYAMIPAGATVVNAPAGPSTGGAGDAGSSHVDDLAQQMGGWRIT